MSCLATKQVELCNCSEPRFPINSSACFSLEQSKSNLFHHFLFISLFYLFQTRERIPLVLISKGFSFEIQGIITYFNSCSIWKTPLYAEVKIIRKIDSRIFHFSGNMANRRCCVILNVVFLSSFFHYCIYYAIFCLPIT